MLLVIVLNFLTNSFFHSYATFLRFQVDICPEEFHNSIKSEVAVHSDINPFVEALTQKLAEKKFSLEPSTNAWWKTLKGKQAANAKIVEVSVVRSKSFTLDSV